MSGLHRRSLLGRTAAIAVSVKPVLAAAEATGPNPDASLIAWCKTFNAQRARIEAAFHAAPEDDWDEAEATSDLIEGELRPLVDLICTNPPTTLEGAQAVAGALMHAMPERDPLRGDEPQATDEHRLQVALLRGLLHGGAA